ncbi:ATP-binding protein [Streptomyces lavendulae]|uniref:ATP-binding protein n=1 Tax=Streptomyces lavendulae TaxID=1914 RepID=UPI0033DE5988
MNDTQLQNRLTELENRLRQLYLAKASGLPEQSAEDRSEERYSEILPEEGSPAAQDGFGRLCREFGLNTAEAGLLSAAVLPEVSTDCAAAFRMLSAYPRPTAAVGLQLLGLSPAEGIIRGLLQKDCPLLANSLLVIDNPHDPFAERCLRAPDRVLRHLFADPGSPVTGHSHHLRALPVLPPPKRHADADLVTAQLRDDPAATLYLREGVDGAALSAACAALRTVGRTPLLLDTFHLEHTQQDPLDDILFEGRMSRGGILVPLYAQEGDALVPTLSRLTAALARAPIPVLLYGSEMWQEELWKAFPRASLDLRGEKSARARPLAAAAGAVVDFARREAAHRGESLPARSAQDIAYRHAGRSLEQLARHITPQLTCDDLILTAEVRDRLNMLILRIQKREEVLGHHGLRRGGGLGRGATALFAGESGTGKTMAAEAVAGELGFDLYTVSLPSVVSKYIGETEKNLERIFSAAEAMECVVLFDEADTVFSKRGAVKDSNDRHGNLQIGYMLQRLEQFGGLAILTTNLRSNVDSAFNRRFNEVVEFELPTADVRRKLWGRYLGGEVTGACDLDVIAREYHLAGGSIRAAVETAAFLAAAAGRPITTPDVIQAVQTEYAKLGRLFHLPSKGEASEPSA